MTDWLVEWRRCGGWWWLHVCVSVVVVVGGGGGGGGGGFLHLEQLLVLWWWSLHLCGRFMTLDGMGKGKRTRRQDTHVDMKDA